MSRSLVVCALLAAVWILLPRQGNASGSPGLIHRYVSCALQGDMTPVPELFSSATADLSTDEARLRDQWKARFVERTDPGPVPDVPPFEREVIETYRKYWVRVLTGELDETRGEEFLTSNLKRLLAEHRGLSEVSSEDAMDLVKEEIEKDGFHLIMGVTRPWFELMLWTAEDSLRFDVELTDGVQPVTVVMMSGFESKGWSHFATFGRASTGGWATSDALFCLAEDYDRDSEKFTVSYLKHEARHFADYPRFPNLQQIDLEYRGKLTELIFAEDSFSHLVRMFRHAGAPNPDAPHAYANWAVMKDVGKELFGEDVDAGDPRWESVDVTRTKKAARDILKANTSALVEAGADTIQGVVVSSR